MLNTLNHRQRRAIAGAAAAVSILNVSVRGAEQVAAADRQALGRVAVERTSYAERSAEALHRAELHRSMRRVMAPVVIAAERDRIRSLRGPHKQKLLSALTRLETAALRSSNGEFEKKEREVAAAQSSFERARQGVSLLAVAVPITLLGAIFVRSSALRQRFQEILEIPRGFDFEEQAFLERHLAGARSRLQRLMRAIDVLAYLSEKRDAGPARKLIHYCRTLAVGTSFGAGLSAFGAGLVSGSETGAAIGAAGALTIFAAGLIIGARPNLLTSQAEKMRKLFETDAERR